MAYTRDEKGTFLHTLNLIIEAKRNSLGKMGEIHLLVDDLIKVPPFNLSGFPEIAKQLADDQIFGILEGGVLFKYIPNEERVEYIVVRLIKPIEEIQKYKDSLHVEGPWGLVVDDHDGNWYEIYRQGHPENRLRVTKTVGEILALAQGSEYCSMSRPKKAVYLRITPKQVSYNENQARGKLKKLGFTDDHVKNILPKYSEK